MISENYVSGLSVEVKISCLISSILDYFQLSSLKTFSIHQFPTSQNYTQSWYDSQQIISDLETYSLAGLASK